MIKIIIYSDIRIYCEGLSQILSGLDTIEVIAAESSLQDAPSTIKNLSPHVILLDMTMAHSNAMAKKFNQLFPKIKIIALAVPEDEQNIMQCAEAGISGYVAREASIDDLINTVISTEQGEFCCPPKIAAFLFQKIQHLSNCAKQNILSDLTPQPSHQIDELTRREQQIIHLMATGLSNKQVAKKLVIEVSTVKNHVHNILVKLGVSNRVQAIAILQRPLSVGTRSFGLAKGLQNSYS